MLDVYAGLVSLAQQRPIFQSEADFEYAFAQQLQQQEPAASIFHEYQPLPHEALRVDLWIEQNNGAIAFELRYPTRRIVAMQPGEQFALKDHAAQPQHRYDFVKDVEQLERIVAARANTRGYAILLTNDSAYWKAPAKIGATDATFRIHDDAVLNGTLAWAPHTAPGTMPNREQSLQLQGTYALKWRNYSVVGDYQQPYRRFRALIVQVDQSVLRGGSSASS